MWFFTMMSPWIQRNLHPAVSRFPNHPQAEAALLTMSVPNGLPFLALKSVSIDAAKGSEHQGRNCSIKFQFIGMNQLETMKDARCF